MAVRKGGLPPPLEEFQKRGQAPLPDCNVLN
jgi:hypothetical protein